ncbi:hypothetical protein [Mycobacterium intracellulare]|uniref:hypothetical protein n=1 Tax=Mycobacterium intracellulare TaxID=1767 RepID=UPI0009BDF8B9|nr:hypothetical protein [Mycobacterium intracellulare]
MPASGGVDVLMYCFERVRIEARRDGPKTFSMNNEFRLSESPKARFRAIFAEMRLSPVRADGVVIAELAGVFTLCRAVRSYH